MINPPNSSLELSLIALLALCVSLTACTGAKTRSSTASQTANASSPTGNVFDDYLTTDFPPADGFDFPFGRGDGGGSYEDKATGKQHEGWYIATHFAETYSLGIHP